MKYYWLTNSIDTDVIGKYDQSESALNIAGFWKGIENRKINNKMTIPEPIVNPKAKLTSYLSQVKEDIFRLVNMPYFESGYYVSERLKNEIEKNNFTGMVFKEIEDVDKRIKVIY